MIRFGVVGLRRGKSFVRVCNSVGGATVTSLYDIDAETVGRAAQDIGAQAFSDYDAFLASEIDAVVIASPVPFHAQQAIAALDAGKHVLSEVTACDTLEDAHALVAATRRNSTHYMMAENYRYMDDVELIKRLNDDNRFGDVYYGEGEYIHDCRDLWYTEDGSLTWRGKGLLGVYCTHSLGPLLYITGDRVEHVSSMAVPGGKFDPRVQHPTMHLMNMKTTSGITLRVRVDHVSPRPHYMHYYALQGTAGAFETARVEGEPSRVWLADEHEPSRTNRDGARWHPALDQARKYTPERLDVPPEARAGGHGTSEYWMLPEFLAVARGERESPIDIHRALDYTLPGIMATVSAQTLGTPQTVPDSRQF